MDSKHLIEASLKLEHWNESKEKIPCLRYYQIIITLKIRLLFQNVQPKKKKNRASKYNYSLMVMHNNFTGEILSHMK